MNGNDLNSMNGDDLNGDDLNGDDLHGDDLGIGGVFPSIGAWKVHGL